MGCIVRESWDSVCSVRESWDPVCSIRESGDTLSGNNGYSVMESNDTANRVDTSKCNNVLNSVALFAREMIGNDNTSALLLKEN